ncbi:hypothetical protein [Synechococcus sp. GFB01]|uniref:hypothetical protein n=1 Tax=Synechococcus sp. GFB01 TaxID=1662190 RepID=UPI00064FC0AC|nr:hypothetical protein [Synechococcus sp. GFB01]KMM16318.1 hypothetical protein SYNGFB01_12130 [Synechococcus sp. GFB01]
MPLPAAVNARPKGAVAGLWTVLKALILLIPAVLATQAVVNYHQLLDGNAYQVNEWMINYQGGFARRGLSGEILLAVARGLGGLDLGAWALLLTGLSAWGYALATLPRLLTARLPVAVAAAYAPVFYPMFLFWDANAVARKDVLALLFTLALLALTRLRARAMPGILLAGGGIGLALLSLTHEALFFFAAPVFLIIGWLGLRRRGISRRRALLRLGLSSAPALLAMLAIAVWGSVPSQAAVEAMCMAWKDLDAAMICAPLQPAFDAVTNPENYVGELPQTWGGDWRQYRRVLLMLLYLGALFGAVLPELMAGLGSRRRLRRRSLLVAAGCLLPTVPLYAVSTDYGRWLATAASCACLILLWGEHLFAPRLAVVGEPAAPGRSGEAAGAGTALRTAGVGLALLMALFAYTKHCCSQDFLLINPRSAFTSGLKALIGR